MKKQSGFIQIIVLIIVFVVVAFYFGKNPVEIWENIRPAFESVLDFFVTAVDFLIRTIARAWEN